VGGAGWVAGAGEGGMTRSSKSINETNTIHVQTSSSSVQAIDVQSGAVEASIMRRHSQTSSKNSVR